MSERKVLNKYFPKDYDPSKIPKANRPRNRQFTIRTMVPCNMRCSTCGEYIYKGKKFNSRCEIAEGEDYLGLRIMRFYIRCPKCVSEITFKTDPVNQDYALEHGATRNFEAQRTAERLAQEEQDKEREEEENNPMKMLEKRTKQSQKEMDSLEQLEELREQSVRKAQVNTATMLEMNTEYEKQLLRLQEEEDEKFIRSVFGGPSASGDVIKRLDSSDEDGDVTSAPPTLAPPGARPSDILTSGNKEATDEGDKKKETKPQAWDKKVGRLGGKAGLAGLVRKRPAPPGSNTGNNDDRPAPKRPNAAPVTENGTKNNADSGEKLNNVAGGSGSAEQGSGVDKGNGVSALGLLGGYSDSDSAASD